MPKPKQHKLRFKPTPISRLLRRPASPMKMVGYPVAHDWLRYYDLNYKQMMEEKRKQMTAERAVVEFGPVQDGIF